MKRCHHCGTPWVSEKKQPGVKEYCEKCSAYLHCCLNCRFFDATKHNQCAIPTTEWVSDKAGVNFCDEFEFADSDYPTQESKDAAEAKALLDALFGGGSSSGESAGGKEA